MSGSVAGGVGIGSDPLVTDLAESRFGYTEFQPRLSY